MIEAIRVACHQQVDLISRMAVEESKLGRYEDKVQKNILAIDKTPGPEVLLTKAVSGDQGLTINERAPFGVIASITPCTNPTETIINNSISILSGGNTVVYCPHPLAKNVCKYGTRDQPGDHPSGRPAQFDHDLACPYHRYGPKPDDPQKGQIVGRNWWP
jgi:propionaldehyde dehydrogenase